jgi:hypothetical protein
MRTDLRVTIFYEGSGVYHGRITDVKARDVFQLEGDYKYHQAICDAEVQNNECFVPSVECRFPGTESEAFT